MMNLGPISTIPRGEGRQFQVGELSIAVFHTRDGNVFATEPACPHKGGPLADGLVGAEKVICPLHGFVFDLTDGHSMGSVCRSLKTYPVTIDDKGDILLGAEQLMVAAR
jgi:nitrite reductase (NADH) small subunit